MNYFFIHLLHGGVIRTSALQHARHDACSNVAVIAGISRRKINNKVGSVSVVAPGSSFHFQLTSIAAAAPPLLLSKYNLSFCTQSEISPRLEATEPFYRSVNNVGDSLNVIKF